MAAGIRSTNLPDQTPDQTPDQAPDQTPEQAPLGAKEKIATLGVGAGYVLGLGAALQLVALLLGASPLGEAVVGALIVDLAAGRAPLTWALDGAARSVLIRRCAAAAGAAIAPLLAVIVLALLLGWARPHEGRVDLYFALSLGAVVAIAIRDELLLRALPLHFAGKAGVHPIAASVFTAALSPAQLIASKPTAASVALSFASGLLFAAAYVRFRGAWAAIAAHTAWSLVIGPGTHGGFTDLEWLRGDLTDGVRASGAAPWIAAGLAAAAAGALLRAERSSRVETAEEPGRVDAP